MFEVPQYTSADCNAYTQKGISVYYVSNNTSDLTKVRVLDEFFVESLTSTKSYCKLSNEYFMSTGL